MSGVALRDVTKVFGRVTALSRVSLEVASGELVALLGPSGCGKTTMLRVIAGLERPDAGRVWIDGSDVTDLATRERPIGMVFQSYALFPNLTIWNNIAFPLVVRRRKRHEIETRVAELLELVHLTGEAGRYPNQVSGGQQQRAALARALAPSPAVLLLDEPLSALDALVRTRLRDEIRRVQQAVRTTAIYVTHDQAEAMAIADRVAVMRLGRIEQIAPPRELYEAPATAFSATFVGSRNALELPVLDGQVSLGSAFTVRAPPQVSGMVLAFFRPEDVVVSLGGAGQLARIEIKIFLGSTTRLHLVTRGEDGRVAHLHADVPSRDAVALEPGCRVGVRIAPQSVQLFPVGGA